MIISNINHAAKLQQLWYLTTRNSTWASNYDAQGRLSTKQQVIGCVQGNIRLQGISRVRKLEHRNTDSNRSTGGNKYYKSKIGRKGEMLAWKHCRRFIRRSGRHSHQLNGLIREEPKHWKKHRMHYLILRQKIGHDACMMYDMAKMRCD